MIKKIKNKNGFSVVELIVVISIFAMMTTMSLFNYNDHKNKIETTGLAQNIALTVRQAQVYGISASAANIGSEGFDAEIFFDNTEMAVDITQDKPIRGTSFYFDDKKIVIFEDINRDNAYDILIDRMIDKREFEYVDTSFITFNMCNADGACVIREGGRLDISFERPYPDAVIKWFSNQSSTIGGELFSKAIIKVGSESYQKTIEINSIGNIVVK